MSDVNLRAELRKGYLLFRAFENGIKAAEQLEQLEQVCSEKEKAIAEYSKKEDAAKKKFVDLEIALENAFKQSETEINDAISGLRVQLKDAEDKFKARLADHDKREKKIVSDIVVKEEKLKMLDADVAKLMAQKDIFAKEIEEAKAKFRSML